MATSIIVPSSTSGIDYSLPADNVRAVKGDLRDNLRAAHDSIVEAKKASSLAWQSALGNVTLLS